MPLHLLAKKSWNVYNPANVARVRADEAAAAAREEAEEQRMQEADAERRIAILRGVTPPPLPSASAESFESGHKRNRSDKRDNDRSTHDRKRRRLRGEDDTERDIRLAQATTAPAGNDDDLGARGWKPTVAADAPVVDHQGHISLFPVDEKAARKGERNEKTEREKKKKEREEEQQTGMKFKDAGGKGVAAMPWYSADKKDEQAGFQVDDKLLELLPEKDVWGKPDPRRKERELQRINANDPFAVMQRAQAQLKQAERDRRAWVKQREQEIRELRARGERERRRERVGKRKKAHDDEDDLDGFSLENSSKQESRRREEERSSKHRRQRSRSREERHERRSSHRGERKRSRSRDRDRDRGHDSSKHRGQLRGSKRHGGEREPDDQSRRASVASRT